MNYITDQRLQLITNEQVHYLGDYKLSSNTNYIGNCAHNSLNILYNLI